MDVKILMADLKAGLSQEDGPAKAVNTDHRQVQPVQSVLVRAIRAVTGDSLNGIAGRLISYGFNPLIRAEGLDEDKINQALLNAIRERKEHLGAFPKCIQALDVFAKSVREEMAKASKPAPKAPKKAKATKAKVDLETPPTSKQQEVPAS